MDYDSRYCINDFLAFLGIAMHRIYAILCSVVLLLNTWQVLGQSNTNNTLGFSFHSLGGYHYASNPIAKTGQSLNGFTYGFSASVYQYGLKNKLFTDTYGGPKIGLTAKIFQLNNADTFGLSIGFIPSYDLPIITSEKVILAARIGYCLNLNTRQYHQQQNFDNRAISSAVNFGFDIGASAHFTLNKYLEAEFFTGLYHVSNGSLKMPNGGINIVYGSAGISYFPHGMGSTKERKPNYTLTQKKWNYSFQIAAGYRELGYFDYLTQFWVASIGQQYAFSFNKLYSLGIGLDGFYDASQALLYESTLRVRDIKEHQKYHLALGLHQRFTIGKIFLPLGIYHYVAPMKHIKEPVYIRFGLGYQFHPKFFCGLFFKGTINQKQQLQSDFMEWTLGMTL